MPDILEPHVQDLAKILAECYTHAKLDDALARFNAKHLVAGQRLPSLEARFRAVLRNGDGNEAGRGVLAYVIENATYEKHGLADVADALSGSRLFVYHDEENVPRIALRLTATAEALVNTHRTFTEAVAPQDVQNQLAKANEALFRHDGDDALHQARKALEALTRDANFNEALDELVSANLISRWDGTGQRRTFDKEFLYASYAYCSTMGSHHPGETSTSSDAQAELGLIFAQEVLHYLLVTIARAREAGVSLEKWVELSDLP